MIGLGLHCMALYRLLHVVNMSNQALVLCKLCIIGMSDVIIAFSTDVVRVMTYMDGTDVIFAHVDVFLQHAFAGKLRQFYDFLHIFLTGDAIATLIILLVDRFLSKIWYL